MEYSFPIDYMDLAAAPKKTFDELPTRQMLRRAPCEETDNAPSRVNMAFEG
jgi:hypothetical protein